MLVVQRKTQMPRFLRPLRKTSVSEVRSRPFHPVRRGANHPRSLVIESPFLLARLVRRRIQVGIAAAKVHYPIHYRRRRLNPNLL